MKNFPKYISSNKQTNFIVLTLIIILVAIGWIATPTAHVQEVTGSNVVAITEDAAQAEMKRQLISVRGGIAQVSEPTTQLAPDVANAIRALPGCTTNTLPANDDGSTAAIALPFSINYFGNTYTQTFVNNNGNITFNAPLGTFTPFDLNTTNVPIIAPFFADVDTRGAGSGLTQYGNTTVNTRAAFCVNWVNVGYFPSMTNLLNSFQLILIERFDTGAGNFDIEFNYNQIVWETGGASGGTGGLGGNSARAGFANGNMTPGTFFELPGSAVNGGLLDSNLATGLTNNSLNSGVIGRYIFNARNGGIPTPTPTPAASPTPTPVASPTPTPVASPTPTPGATPTPTPGGNVCTPSTTVSEGDLFPGGIPSFSVSSGPGSVTIDHVNLGTGTQSVTVVGAPVNAVVMVQPFPPGTFNPVLVTFTTPSPGLAVSFRLRAASSFHAIFIDVRCAETCTPSATVTEGDLFPGGIPSFGVMTGPGSVTIDHVNLGTGLQSLTLVGAPVNAVVTIPMFPAGTINPVVVTFTQPNPALPTSFRLRAASSFHAIFIDVRCGTVTPTPTPGASPTPTPVASPTPTPVVSPTPVASPTPTPGGNPAGTTGTLTQRLFRPGAPGMGTCAPNTFPGTFGTGPYLYNTHRLRNNTNAPICITVTLTAPTAVGSGIHVAAFLAPFVGADISTAARYLGDPGSSSVGTPVMFQATIPAMTSIDLVVFTAGVSPENQGQAYTLTVSGTGGCALAGVIGTAPSANTCTLGP